MKFLLCVLGVALMLEGLPWFAFPEAFKKHLIQILTLPPQAMRIIGFAMMAAGLALFYAGRS